MGGSDGPRVPSSGKGATASGSAPPSSGQTHNSATELAKESNSSSQPPSSPARTPSGLIRCLLDRVAGNRRGRRRGWSRPIPHRSSRHTGCGARGLLNQAAPAPLSRESRPSLEQNLVAQGRKQSGTATPREHNSRPRSGPLTRRRRAPALACRSFSPSHRPCSPSSRRANRRRARWGAAWKPVLERGCSCRARHGERRNFCCCFRSRARRQLLDVSDEVATKVSFLFYSDAQDALVKALDE